MEENIKQYTSLDGKALTVINIGKFTSEKADSIKRQLNEKTFMCFEICIAPFNGSFNVTAETDYQGSTEEIMGMFIFLMACNL